MSTSDQRLNLVFDFKTTGVMGNSSGYDLSNQPTLRVVTENVGGINAIVVEGKLKDQSNWETIQTILGVDSQYIDISSYELIRFRCSIYNAAGVPKLIAASFFKRPISGSVEIGCPNGDDLSTRSFNFVSSDSSVTITGNAATNEIDLKAASTGAALSSLTDVDLDSPITGEIIKYNFVSGKWENSEELITIQNQNPPILLENNTGSTILAYTPVRVNTSGDMDLIDVSSPNAIGIIGLLAENTNDGDQGEIKSDRVVKNTSVAFNFGDILYVNKTGTLTNILPQVGIDDFVSGDFVIKVGVVSKNQDNPLNKDIIMEPDVIVQLV